MAYAAEDRRACRSGRRHGAARVRHQAYLRTSFSSPCWARGQKNHAPDLPAKTHSKIPAPPDSEPPHLLAQSKSKTHIGVSVHSNAASAVHGKTAGEGKESGGRHGAGSYYPARIIPLKKPCAFSRNLNNRSALLNSRKPLRQLGITVSNTVCDTPWKANPHTKTIARERHPPM